MGLIREPKGVDFIIQSPPLTKEEQREISEFIKMRKARKLAETGKKKPAKKRRQKEIV